MARALFAMLVAVILVAAADERCSDELDCEAKISAIYEELVRTCTALT